MTCGETNESNESNENYIWKSYLTGPRWRLPEGTMRKCVLDSRLPSLKIISEIRTKTFSTATVFFEIEGKLNEIKLFQKAVLEAIKNG